MKNFTNNFKQFTLRLSARWLIMALMMLVGTSSAWGANNITIYYVNTNSWESVNCYAWKDGGSSNEAWPGVSMTKVNNGLYSYILDKDLYNKCIFNNGSSQTGDLTLEDGKYYYAEDKWYSNLEEYYTGKGYVYLNAGDYIYMKNFIPSGWNNTTWIVSNGYAWAHIWGPADDFSSIFELVSGTHATVGAIYRAEIKTSGWYKNIQFTRTNSNTEPFNGAWNDTETIPLEEGNNCATNWTDNGTTADWEIYTPPANAGFWKEKAWNIQYYAGSGNADMWLTEHVDAGKTFDLGTINGTPYIKGFTVNLWRNTTSGNVCGLQSVTYKIDDKDPVGMNLDGIVRTQSQEGTTQNVYFTKESKDGGNAFNIALPNTEGEHTVKFTFTASVDNNSNSNCDETTTMTGTITYEIPECSVPDGITIQYADDEKKFCVNSNVTLSPSVDHVDGYTYAWVVSGTGWSINSGSAARECEVKVGTSEGSVKLTVSNATCSKEATTLDKTPTVPDLIATPTISAENQNQIVCNGNDAFLSVASLTSGATYTLVFEGSEQADPTPIPYSGSEEVKFAISKAGSYTVVAKTTDTEACQYTARATNEIDFTSISFSQSEYTTTPWVPVSVVVNAPEGTTYEYDDTDITGTTALKDAPIKTVSNNTYTYKLPRPTAWGTGNATTTNDVEFEVKANIATCEATAKVILQDEGDDKCTEPNN